MKLFNKLVLLIIFVSISCTEVLEDVQPSTALSDQVALNSESGINAFRAGIYNRLQGFDYSTELMLGPSALADELASRPGSSRFAGLAENTRAAGVSSYASMWDIINECNIMLVNVDGSLLPDGVYEQYRAEALTIRAFVYHHAVRTLGYEPGVEPTTGQGAGFNLGVEIRTQPVTSAEQADFRPRKTNVEVYNLIKSDLTNAIEIFESLNNSGDIRFVNVAFAKGLLARVYLYERDYTNANSMAQEAIEAASVLGSRLATSSEVVSMFNETAGFNIESLFTVVVNPATESLGTNNSISSYTALQWMAMVPTQDQMDLYESGDARLGWYGPCFDEANNVLIDNCLATHPDIAGGANGLEIQKYQQEPQQFADDIVMMRIAELLLIQAEARLLGNLGNETEPFNLLRESRNVAPLTQITLDDILNERRRELVAEGHRFFDLKRLGRTIRKAPELLSGIIQDVPYDDYRVLDDYPQNEIELSIANAPDPDSVLVQNPGYLN